MMIRTAFVVLIALALASFGRNLRAAPQYHVTDLGVLPDGNGSRGFGLNNVGQEVGMSDVGVPNVPNGYDHAFLYSGGTMSDLGTLGGTFSQAQGINESGQIVGYSTDSDGFADPFLYSGGTMINLGTVPGVTGGGVAYGITNDGRIVGYSGASNQPHAFFYNGTMHNLGSFPGATYSGAYAINNTGQIVGYSDTAGDLHYHAFSYSSGTMTDIGTLPGGVNSLAYGINSAGKIVGFSQGAGDIYHAFLYDGGTMSDLGTLGLGYSQAYGINDSGQIVGAVDTANGYSNDHRAFLYSDGVMSNLNSLLDSSGAGWTLYSADAINNKGWIVGYGLNPNSVFDAVLLTPVPEPSSLILLAVSACSLGWWVIVARSR